MKPGGAGWKLKLAACGREVIELEKVGRHDNFFELADLSLLATR